jgi:hypothetical protein
VVTGDSMVAKGSGSARGGAETVGGESNPPGEDAVAKESERAPELASVRLSSEPSPGASRAADPGSGDGNDGAVPSNVGVLRCSADSWGDDAGTGHLSLLGVGRLGHSRHVVPILPGLKNGNYGTLARYTPQESAPKKRPYPDVGEPGASARGGTGQCHSRVRPPGAFIPGSPPLRGEAAHSFLAVNTLRSFKS